MKEKDAIEKALVKNVADLEPEVISVADSEEDLIRITKAVEIVERDIQIFKKVKTLSMSLTNESDWIVQGDGLYLQDSGSQKIAQPWGIKSRILKDTNGKPIIEKEIHSDKKGEYYVFVAYGAGFSAKLGKSVEDVGTGSQRDKFFGMKAGELREVEDIDINMIRKKAITNMHNRIVKRIIGLSSVTKEELKEAGLNIDKIHRVEYETGSQKAAAVLSDESKKKRNEIWKICLNLANGNEKDAAFVLSQVSYFKDKDGNDHKLNDIKRLTSPKWIDSILKRAKERYAEFAPPEVTGESE